MKDYKYDINNVFLFLCECSFVWRVYQHCYLASIKLSKYYLFCPWSRVWIFLFRPRVTMDLFQMWWSWILSTREKQWLFQSSQVTCMQHIKLVWIKRWADLIIFNIDQIIVQGVQANLYHSQPDFLIYHDHNYHVMELEVFSIYNYNLFFTN